jgi:hypothetical protein
MRGPASSAARAVGSHGPHRQVARTSNSWRSPSGPAHGDGGPRIEVCRQRHDEHGREYVRERVALPDYEEALARLRSMGRWLPKSAHQISPRLNDGPGVERVGPCIEARCGERLVVSHAGGEALHVPAARVRTTKHDNCDLLTLTKLKAVRGLQDAVLVASFDRPHTWTLARRSAALTSSAERSCAVIRFPPVQSYRDG